jgi:hypothetical protein
MAATNKRMKMGMWNFLWTQIMNVFTNSALSMSTVTSTATVRNFYVI